MSKHAASLFILTLALIALASVPGIGATGATPAIAPPPDQPVIALEEAAPDPPAPPVVDVDRHTVDWQEPTLAIRPQGVTPDGSFTDPESLAGTRQLDESLDKTSSSNAPGLYMARDWRPVGKADFPMLVGGHDTFQWRELEPTEGAFDWTRLDNTVAINAASGKRTAFGITAYNGRIEGGVVVPNWLKANYSQTIITCSGDGWQIPKYWNSVYKAKYTAFIQALADRYKNNANVAWVQIGVGLYGEIQPSDDRDDQCVKDAMAADGRTDYEDFWTQTLDSYIDIFAARFDSGKPVFLVYTPSFVSKNEKCNATYYGAGKYPGYFGLFSGGVYANTADIFSAWPAVTYPGNCSKWDPILYWNNSPTATIPVAFETYRYMLPNLDTYYWGMLNALNKHPDYLNLESDLFFSNSSDPWGSKITENFPMMYFANHYLGKTLATTPNVWVAMREYDPATNGFGYHNAYVKPQWGNYDFWLTQDNTIAGGRMVSATTVNQYWDDNADVWRTDAFYDPILVGKGPQGWITRRTGHASGNDYVYLNVNDTFASTRLQVPTMITVTWFDVITTTGTTWALEYKDTGGNTQSLTRNRLNSRQWVTSTFYIADASFTGQFANGNDFRLYNGGTADLYVHFVSVGPAVGGPPITETPTRTPIVTATGTRTPTFTPTRTNTATITPAPTSGYDLRVNAGGPGYTDSTGHLWSADKAYAAGSWGYAVAGSTYTTTTAIMGTSDAPLFQAERWWEGNGAYRFDVPASGLYDVSLSFSENAVSVWKTGIRIFNVNMEGQLVYSNFDIFARAPGQFRALVVSTTVAVGDGALNIDFVRIVGKGNPKVNAIHVLAKAPPTPTPTRTATWIATPTGGWPHKLRLPVILSGFS